MKNNYGVVAVTIDPAKYPMGDVIHLCLYENPPTDNDINALIEELATDETFGMTHLKDGVDYGLMQLNDEAFAKMKVDMNIPDEFPESVDTEDNLVVQPSD